MLTPLINTQFQLTQPGLKCAVAVDPLDQHGPCVDGSELARVFFTVQVGRCGHVFGLFARLTGPLAIMPSADQVPVNFPHSTMRWPEWVVLIAGSTDSALRAVRPPNLHITPDVQRDLVYAASATGSL
jgi:hypothetical protein